MSHMRAQDGLRSISRAINVESVSLTLTITVHTSSSSSPGPHSPTPSAIDMHDIVRHCPDQDEGAEPSH